MIKKITDGFQMNVCMYMYIIYIELLKDEVIKCEINPILYVNHHLSCVPIYSNSLKALWDTGNYFIISYISHNVLIRIWSALTGNILKRIWQLVAFIIFSTCSKNWITWKCFILNPTKFASVEKYFCVLSEQNQDTMIISKVILFNQPWFQCYFLPQEA